MKENSREEEINYLDSMVKEYRQFGNLYNEDYEDEERIYQALEHILSDYKRVVKENEELKLYNNSITSQLEQMTTEKFKKGWIHQSEFKDLIPVQKVKDRIEKEIKYHEKNILDIENIAMLKNKTAKEEAEIEFNKYTIVVLKKILQELLEGRK